MSVVGDITVAEVATRLEWCLAHLDELSPEARNALLAICGDAAGVIERRLELASSGTASRSA